jgi:hypothetical protein
MQSDSKKGKKEKKFQSFTVQRSQEQNKDLANTRINGKKNNYFQN